MDGIFASLVVVLLLLAGSSQGSLIQQRGEGGVIVQHFGPDGDGGAAAATTAVGDSLKGPSWPQGDACKCGQSTLTTGKIVGGKPAALGEVPWQVRVETTYLNTTDHKTYIGACGGTIIHSEWVLTAAHCFVSADMQVKSVRIYAGVLGIEEGVPYDVTSLNYPAQYSPTTNLHDISLLKIKGSFPFDSPKIQPACLPYKYKGEFQMKGKTVASGWGTTSSNGPPSNVLLMVQLDLISNRECAKYIPSIANTQSCTYTPDKDTCQGDSGGPVAYRAGPPNGNGKYYVVGAVSYGVGCALKDNPGVNTRVSEYLSYIESTTEITGYCKE